MPADLSPERREELLERVYRGGYRRRRIKHFRWASAALAALLVVVAVPALLLASPGNDKKTLHTADEATTTVPVVGTGVVTPVPADGPTTTTTVAGSVTPVVPTTAQPSVHLVPAAPLVPPVQPVGHWVSEQSGTTQTLRAVSFPDALHGWAVGDNVILATIDGGAHWIQQTAPVDDHFSGVSFVDDMHGWAVGGSILATSDGGAHWVAQNAPTDNYMGVSFVDKDHGWVISRSGLVATTDGGAHWTTQLPSAASPDQVNPGYCVFFADQQHGWTGWGSKVMATTDGGAHWAGQSEPGFYTGLSFVDSRTGFAVGPSGGISTTDGGSSWQKAQLPQNLGSVAATDAHHAWVTASGNGGIILATADGVNWFQQWQGGPGFNGISFPDATDGWAVGNGGIIVRYLPD